MAYWGCFGSLSHSWGCVMELYKRIKVEDLKCISASRLGRIAELNLQLQILRAANSELQDQIESLVSSDIQLERQLRKLIEAVDAYLENEDKLPGLRHHARMNLGDARDTAEAHL
jgi:phosphoglycerate-specific signal transduction histidine kinase